MKRFGEYVREARKEKGWTLEQVARAARSQKGYQCGIERGKVSPPSTKVVARLCKKLDLPEAYMQALAYLEKKPEAVTLDALYNAVVAATQERDAKLTVAVEPK